MTRILGRKPPLIPDQQRAASRFAFVVCPDVSGMSRWSRWSGAPASETLVISRLVRLQQATRSDSGSCGGNTVGVQVPPFACLFPKLFAFFAEAPAQWALGPAQFPYQRASGRAARTAPARARCRSASTSRSGAGA